MPDANPTHQGPEGERLEGVEGSFSLIFIGKLLKKNGCQCHRQVKGGCKLDDDVV
jgi:hypothetical protein